MAIVAHIIITVLLVLPGVILMICEKKRSE